jgi:hypothetical protein
MNPHLCDHTRSRSFRGRLFLHVRGGPCQECGRPLSLEAPPEARILQTALVCLFPAYLYFEFFNTFGSFSPFTQVYGWTASAPAAGLASIAAYLVVGWCLTLALSEVVQR